jgi:hypothetical protein
MTTVVVVQHERRSADTIASALRAAGYTVQACCGPEAYPCPILEGERCDFVDEADVLVYGLGLQPIGPETDAVLLGLLRWSKPGTPLIVADEHLPGAGRVGELAIRDRLVRVMPAPFTAEQVVQVVAEALAARPTPGAA